MIREMLFDNSNIHSQNEYSLKCAYVWESPNFFFETLTPETLATRTPAFGTPAFGTLAFGTPLFGTYSVLSKFMPFWF